MSDNWDSYFCQVDGAPASILVDLDLATQLPRHDFPYLSYISLTLQRPDRHGLPVADEYDRLGRVEDALEAALTAGGRAVYAGRCASGGRFDLFYYSRSGADWQPDVSAVMASFAEYQWEAGGKDDPAWESYIYFLFPDEYAMNGIQNRRALQVLTGEGDDPEQSRSIEHWAVFSDQQAAHSFIRAVEVAGFAVAGLFASEGGSEQENQSTELVPPAHSDPRMGELLLSAGTLFSPQAQRPGLPESPGGGVAAGEVQVRFTRPDPLADIDAVTFTLVDLARAHGGAYQGWACPLAED